MPVIGHAFVGIAAAICTRPDITNPTASTGRLLAVASWVPLVVGLAYAPDIAAQALVSVGYAEARTLTHSIWFAAGWSGVMTLSLSRLGACSAARALAVSGSMVFIHDLMDLLQATDRKPLWPVSDRALALTTPIIPADPWKEAVLFAGCFACFVMLRWIIVRRRVRMERTARASAPRWVVWVGRVGVATILVAAVVTHSLRDVRERQLQAARTRLEFQDYRSAVELIERADRWPSTAKPGRADHVRAEAYAGLGDRKRAEFYYRRSDQADPTYFWVVADLAAFYASADRPLAERRRLASPYVNRLHAHFSGQAELPRILARIDLKLREP